MGWHATDDRFPFHSKRLALLQFAVHDSAMALWSLAGPWCSAQDANSLTGFVPAHMVAAFGTQNAQEAAQALVDVGLWEVTEGGYRFHDWGHWNGPEARQNRSKEQTRKRTHATRLRKCEAGTHSKDCPTTDLDGEPWACPRRVARDAKTAPSTGVSARSATPGRAGTGRGREGLT